MSKPPIEKKGSTHQKFLIKTVLHVILITILSVGIVHANGGSLLECCGLCEIAGSGHGQPHQENDMHNDGSSCSRASPCYDVLKFLAETEKSDISSQFVKESPTTINFAAAATGVFLLGHPNQYFAYLERLQNKVPDVPLFNINSSLLF
jgi:hypothetical protein